MGTLNFLVKHVDLGTAETLPSQPRAPGRPYCASDLADPNPRTIPALLPRLTFAEPSPAPPAGPPAASSYPFAVLLPDGPPPPDGPAARDSPAPRRPCCPCLAGLTWPAECLEDGGAPAPLAALISACTKAAAAERPSAEE
eukprot:839034-Prymnesium_polylepis.1